MPGYSASQSSSAATGAISQKGATQFISGGSSGLSTTMIVALVAAALAVAWFLLGRKKGRK